MKIYYYLTVFPTEGLIASQLGPEDFGSYMATGSKKGTAEHLIFIEVSGEFGSYFDWDYAIQNCVPHSDGRPKHSKYLAVYRALENTPLDKLGAMYLTTRDGRSVRLEKSVYKEPENPAEFHLYQELCPVYPLVVSKLNAGNFAKHLTSDSNKVFVPQIVFADLKLVNVDDPEHTGNIGTLYSRNIQHLKGCIAQLRSSNDKQNKTLDRTHVESFGFQHIGKAIYVANSKETIAYNMLTMDELQRDHFPWAKSANIL